MRARDIAIWTIIYGLVWNALGWAGNNLLLESAWDDVATRLTVGFAPPWSGLTKELLSFVSDFVYAFAFVWLFAQFRDQSVWTALKLVTVLWLAGAAVTYLAIVNSGFLPLSIAVMTGVLALAIFVITAPILPLALSRKVEGDRASSSRSF